MDKEFVTKKKVDEEFKKNNSIKKRLLIFFGTIILMLLLVLIIYIVFFKNLELEKNVSVNKSIDYIEISNNKIKVTTQTYVSDLGYSMKYDISNFDVFKYKKQDVYKCITNNNIVLSIEKSNLPEFCLESSSNVYKYNNCSLMSNGNEEVYYFYKNDNVYKIKVVIPSSLKSVNDYMIIIEYMMSSFEMEE